MRACRPPPLGEKNEDRAKPKWKSRWYSNWKANINREDWGAPLIAIISDLKANINREDWGAPLIAKIILTTLGTGHQAIYIYIPRELYIPSQSNQPASQPAYQPASQPIGPQKSKKQIFHVCTPKPFLRLCMCV